MTIVCGLPLRFCELGLASTREDAITHAIMLGLSLNPFSIRGTWSQYPPNPPKAASWTQQAEKGPLLHVFQ
ncbi:unnamed protein product [Caretta caretta]